MKLQAFLPALVCLTSACLLQNAALGCQPQLCRRRRGIADTGTVSLKLDGCSGTSPSWTRQIAYCLKLSVTKMALNIKSWYSDTYDQCAQNGCARYISERKNSDVDDCVQCWKQAAIANEDSLKDFNVTEDSVADCVEDYIEAYLDNELPTFERLSRFKSGVNLAAVRPAEYWWSVKVELPCKPKVFEYWNAYCVNSFAEDLKDGDYVLVQNSLITKDQISFFVEFSESCIFEPEEINIIWDESTPAPGLPQVSSFPSQFPPNGGEVVDIYYDLDAARQLTNTDDGQVEEYKRARLLSKEKLRKKRQAQRSRLHLVGLQFPCEVRSFQRADADGERTYQITDKASRRLLIDTNLLARYPNGTIMERNPHLNFSLDFGYERTGCIFDSGEINVVLSPPPDWVKAKIVEQRSSRLTCATCVNKQNDKDCLDMGTTNVCASGEVCQSEVRQITPTLKLITKSCKQRFACNRTSLGRSSDQCAPGKPGSVCRCCCATAMCNAGSQHHSGDLFICKI